MPSVALVSQLFTLTQELILTYLAEDCGSYLVEEVSEHMCVEKSLKRAYPCIIPAGSRRAALVLLHPLPSSDGWVGGSFSEREGQGTVEEIPAVPCTILLRQQWSQALQQLWKLSLGSREEGGQPWGQLGGRDGSRSLGLVHRSHRAVLLVLCACASHHLETSSSGVTILLGINTVVWLWLSLLLCYSSCGVDKKHFLMLSMTGYR